MEEGSKMRRFEEWIKEVVREVNRADIGDVERTALLVDIRTAEENRNLEYLNRVMKKLHILELKDFCPAAREIQEWTERGEIRL